MKNTFILILFLFGFTIHSACKKETINTDNKRIDFNNMKVGQFSRYAGSVSKNWTLDTDTTFKPKFDTIQLKILFRNA
jgi:hypothetical protein